MPHVVCAGILVADVFVPPLAAPARGRRAARDRRLPRPAGRRARRTRRSRSRRLGVPTSRSSAASATTRSATLVEHDLRRARDRHERGPRACRACGTSKTVIIPVDRRGPAVHPHVRRQRGSCAPRTSATGALGGADALYVGGYLLLPGAGRSTRSPSGCAAPRARATRIVLDVAVPGRPRPSRSATSPRCSRTSDWFVAERGRGARAQRRARAGAPGAGSSWSAARGRSSSRWASAARSCAAGGERRSTVPAPPVEVVEPSGAGDAFAAGLIARAPRRAGTQRTVRSRACDRRLRLHGARLLGRRLHARRGRGLPRGAAA